MVFKFSVIIPIYKVEKYVRKCIESVMNQTYSNWELILVDDGSPDVLAFVLKDVYLCKSIMRDFGTLWLIKMSA